MFNDPGEKVTYVAPIYEKTECYYNSPKLLG